MNLGDICYVIRYRRLEKLMMNFLVFIIVVSILCNACLDIARYMDEISRYIDSEYKLKFAIIKSIISLIGLLATIFWIILS